jgi:hypothetical protein
MDFPKQEAIVLPNGLASRWEDETGRLWNSYTPFSEVEWQVKKCEFILSRRSVRADALTLDGIRAAISIALIDPTVPTGKPSPPYGFRTRIPLGKNWGRVTVWVQGCKVDTDMVTLEPGAPMGTRKEAVFIRKHFIEAGGYPALVLNPNLPNTSTQGGGDWEWVLNPGMDLGKADGCRSETDAGGNPEARSVVVWAWRPT